MTLLLLQLHAHSAGKYSVATDIILKILGLEICADTIVGNEMVRGISGGQRKRVTTGITCNLQQLQVESDWNIGDPLLVQMQHCNAVCF